MREVIPVPGLSDKYAKSLSRQDRYARRHVANGTCPRCGDEKLAKKKNGKLASLGPKCLKAQREVMRDRLAVATKRDVTKLRRNKNALSYQFNAKRRQAATSRTA